jgi:hypothetical protein
MELFLFSGTLASILVNDIVWKGTPHEMSLETKAFIKHCEYLRERDKHTNTLNDSRT